MAKQNKKNVKMGKYKHFKSDNKKYEVFALAYDDNGTEYVIYQALYGKKLFWMRNKEDFLGSVEIGGNYVKRFTLESEEKDEKQVLKLIGIINKNDVVIINEGNGELYKIYKILNNRVYVCKLNTGAYLSNVELAYRMGYTMYSVNNKIFIRSSTTSLDEDSCLKIKAPDIRDTENFIKTQFNPCSVDLHISDKLFIQTKFLRRIDPTSLESVNNGRKYWKDLNVRNNCIKLKPGQSILTNIYEYIKIPNDCAGKIEIKSTYSRLSLSITEGDFCNPGYEGHFPLVIRNDGNNIVVIHPKEMMAQLILVKVSDSIISNYSQNATHKNDNGYDDGTPYSFWYERSLKKFRNENGAEHFYRYYLAIEKNINSDTTDDINGVKERLKERFLSFIAKKIKEIEPPITAEILERYAIKFVKEEKNKKRLFKSKWPSMLGGVLSAFSSIVVPMLTSLPDDQKKQYLEKIGAFNNWWMLLLLGVILIVIGVYLFVKQPKSFCTFEKMDLGKIAKEVIIEMNEEMAIDNEQ